MRTKSSIRAILEDIHPSLRTLPLPHSENREEMLDCVSCLQGFAVVMESLLAKHGRGSLSEGTPVKVLIEQVLAGETSQFAHRRLLDWMEAAFQLLAKKTLHLEKLKSSVADSIVKQFQPRNIEAQVKEFGKGRLFGNGADCWKLFCDRQQKLLLEEDAYNSNTESFVVLKDEIRRARSYLAASVEKQTDMLDALDHLATLAIAVEAVLQSNIDRGRTTPGEIAKTNYEKWLTAIADPDSGDLKKRCDDILEDLHVLGENPEIQLIVFQLRVAQALDPQAIQERAAANGILPTIRDRRCWEHYSNEYRHLDAAVILDFGKRRR